MGMLARLNSSGCVSARVMYLELGCGGGICLGIAGMGCIPRYVIPIYWRGCLAKIWGNAEQKVQ